MYWHHVLCFPARVCLLHADDIFETSQAALHSMKAQAPAPQQVLTEAIRPGPRPMSDSALLTLRRPAPTCPARETSPCLLLHRTFILQDAVPCLLSSMLCVQSTHRVRTVVTLCISKLIHHGFTVQCAAAARCVNLCQGNDHTNQSVSNCVICVLMTIKPPSLWSPYVDQVLPPMITMRDFEKVLTRARPTVGKSDLAIFEKFTAEFGEEAQ